MSRVRYKDEPSLLNNGTARPEEEEDEEASGRFKTKVPKQKEKMRV